MQRGPSLHRGPDTMSATTLQARSTDATLTKWRSQVSSGSWWQYVGAPRAFKGAQDRLPQRLVRLSGSAPHAMANAAFGAPAMFPMGVLKTG
eukprot:scaffold87525_cov58-Phaeocystis_antarctica.AAC.5